MTSPNTPKPSRNANNYEQVHSVGSSFGQDLSPTKVRTMLSNHVSTPFEGFMQGVATSVAKAIRNTLPTGSIFTPVQQAFKDRQDEVQNDIDLLSNLLDYGSCYAPNDKTRVHGNGYVNFSKQIGPMRGCHLEGDRLVLEHEGLWDIRAHVVMDAVISVLSGAFANISTRVYTDTGEPYSEQTFAVSGTQTISAAIISSVVVPRPGFYVRVYIENPIDRRGILAGPRWSRLTAQHISDETGVGNNGNESSSTVTTE